jgi:hypothetical protein
MRGEDGYAMEAERWRRKAGTGLGWWVTMVAMPRAESKMNRRDGSGCDRN